MIALFANPEQIGHRAEGHPERPERVGAILEAIKAAELALAPDVAPPAPDSMITRVHDPRYVALLDRTGDAGGGYLDPDTYITPLSMRAARTARICKRRAPPAFAPVISLGRVEPPNAMRVVK